MKVTVVWAEMQITHVFKDLAYHDVSAFQLKKLFLYHFNLN